MKNLYEVDRRGIVSKLAPWTRIAPADGVLVAASDRHQAQLLANRYFHGQAALSTVYDVPGGPVRNCVS